MTTIEKRNERALALAEEARKEGLRILEYIEGRKELLRLTEIEKQSGMTRQLINRILHHNKNREADKKLGIPTHHLDKLIPVMKKLGYR